MSDTILVVPDNHVLTLTLNRPDKKNALTHAMYDRLASEIAAAQTNDAIRCVVITGTGDMFTSGNDLMDFRNSPPLGQDTPVSRFLSAISTAEKPLIAAVNGLAVGVGLTMLLHCDLVIASETAGFKAPFVDLALVPEAASSLLLPQRVGHAWANDIFLTGRTVTAEEALRLGIVSRIVAQDALAGETASLAAALSAKAPAAVKATKSLMKSANDQVPARMAEESALFVRQLQSAEFMEAVNAFMEKRPPKFG